MNNRRIVSTLFVLTVIVVAAYVYQSGFRMPLESAKAADTPTDDEIGPSSIATHDEDDSDELLKLVKATIKSDEWISIEGPTMILKTNQLYETKANEAEHILTLDLFRGDAMLARQTRYFANHHGPVKEVPIPYASHLACAMYPIGFLSGNCEVEGKSDKEVTLSVDWLFDDKRSNLKTIFRCDFGATVTSSGIIDCENGATLHWNLERKSTEQ